jgi:hypothetical protein
MTDTKARETFSHPLLDRIDEEKRAMRGVLKALDGLDEKGARDVLDRVIASFPVRATGGFIAPAGRLNGTAVDPSMVPGFGTTNGISGGGKTE